MVKGIIEKRYPQKLRWRHSRHGKGTNDALSQCHSTHICLFPVFFLQHAHRSFLDSTHQSFPCIPSLAHAFVTCSVQWMSPCKFFHYFSVHVCVRTQIGLSLYPTSSLHTLLHRIYNSSEMSFWYTKFSSQFYNRRVGALTHQWPFWGVLTS